MTNIMRITEHFTYEEFTRTSRAELQDENSANGAAYAHNFIAIAKELEKIREHLARPIFITSGYRCPALNAAVGGAGMSQHLTGAAADFVVRDFQDLDGCKRVFEWARRNCTFGQLILEAPAGRKPWIHLGLPEPLRKMEQQAMVWDGVKYERVL
jgi:hypothetical protein